MIRDDGKETFLKNFQRVQINVSQRFIVIPLGIESLPPSKGQQFEIPTGSSEYLSILRNHPV